MKISIPELAIAILFVVTSNIAFSQNEDSVYIEQFYSSIQDTNWGVFESCRPKVNDTNKFYKKRIDAIKKLDDALVQFNEFTLNRDYDTLQILYALSLPDMDNIKSDTFVLRRMSKARVNYKLDSIYLGGLEKLMILCDLHLGFNRSKNSNQYLSFVEDYTNLQRMHIEYNNFMNDMETNQKEYIPIYSPKYDMNKHLQSIANRMHEIERLEFTMYRTYSATAKKAKSFHFNHGNDVLLGSIIGNQDQEMTGSFRFDLATDYFKARWFSGSWLYSGLIGVATRKNIRIHKLKHPRFSMLSYQNISFGGDGFTPYIRYLGNTQLADTLHQHDRPFGSYYFVERRKFRLWPKGVIRHSGQFQIGRIGLASGQWIQAELHKDAVVESQQVYGWNKQVGNGGRWLLQINHELDLLLFSTSNKYPGIFSYRKPQDVGKFSYRKPVSDLAFGRLTNKYSGLNVIGNIDVRIGGYLTALTGGITLSSLDFLHQSGHNVILPRRNNRMAFGWHVEAGLKYRYVIHNTMLEGLGYFKTFKKDKYDNENTSVYTLSPDMVCKDLWLLHAKFVFQWRRMAFYYKMNFNRIEYSTSTIDLDSEEIMKIVEEHGTIDDDFSGYYESVIKPEFNRSQNRKFYGFGTLGMTWMIGN